MHSSFKSFLPHDVDACEPDVTVEYDYHAAEKMTRDYPGSDEHCEVTDVLLDGESVLAEMSAEMLELFAEEALEHAVSGRDWGD
ncbi:hypothetical protein LCGC14_1411130 [marine sediment metagenome]|uniref:Uncharacterized protein n=1 Tax=marine sediment metagenome TaxID=412755 RepID=A0A0F9M9M9_9ZZZZ